MSVALEAGDFVRDQMDEGRLRKVDDIWGTTVYLADGGVMGLDEVRDEDVVLESEGHHEYYNQ